MRIVDRRLSAAVIGAPVNPDITGRRPVRLGVVTVRFWQASDCSIDRRARRPVQSLDAWGTLGRAGWRHGRPSKAWGAQAGGNVRPARYGMLRNTKSGPIWRPFNPA